jgi:hypothetical protein
MKRTSVALGILGLVWAAAMPASAQTTIQLFGKTYNVVKESRAQTYKNALKVVLPPRDLSLQDASLDFVQGPDADPSKDRLFVGSNVQVDPDNVICDQFYLLTGADENGAFTKSSAALTQYFGGAVDADRGGRPTGHMWLNDDNTGGVKKDRNIAISTYSGDDWFRLFDFDSMNGVASDTQVGTDQISDMVYGIPLAQDNEFNAPGASYSNYARMPQWDNHTVVVVAQRTGDVGTGPGINVWDTRTDSMFPIATSLQDVTASAAKPFPVELTQCYAIIQYSGNEYWLLCTDVGIGNPTDSSTTTKIVRVKLTFPTDMTVAKPNGIGVEVLDISQELKGSALTATLSDGQGTPYGMTKGREVAPGLSRLYFGDSEGNIFTATPVP